MAFESRNPVTGEIVAKFDNMSDVQIEAALTASMSAQKTLKSWSMDKRKAAMHRIADILDAEAEALGAIITLEMGKTLKSAIGEVKKCAMGCRYYADHAEGMMADEPVEATSATTYKTYLPLGPIMVVMPWNYPLWQVYRFVGPALMAGNTGLLKHASNVPQCSLSVEDVVRRAGFPEGTLQNIFVTTDQVGQMLRLLCRVQILIRLSASGLRLERKIAVSPASPESALLYIPIYMMNFGRSLRLVLRHLSSEIQIIRKRISAL